MKIYTSYKVKIKHYNGIFKDTVTVYRHAVDFLLDVCDREWDSVSLAEEGVRRQRAVETLIHATKSNPHPAYDFDKKFYKMPCYLRRAAINEALGKVSSYRSNLANWEASDKKDRKPSLEKAGCVYPSMYRGDMYKQTGTYEAQIKVYVRNTWDWITVSLRKSDVDYINRYCAGRRKCVPTLQKKGKQWYLTFSFEENVKLNDKPVTERTILSVDLGINSQAVVNAMHSDGTILGRHFLSLPCEKDSLMHAVNRIKKAQQDGSYRTPSLWGRARGLNHDISVRTAAFIMDIAALYNADVIVFEHLDMQGKKKGSKKQRLHLWKCREVQSIVTNQAHRCGIHISHVCAWGTSRLAYDGSGRVLRGKEAGLSSYSMCKFQNGKIYNCDLSASYNIGARYFIREILKSLPVKVRLDIEAKVPQCTKRSTCTLSTLINLNAAIMSLQA